MRHEKIREIQRLLKEVDECCNRDQLSKLQKVSQGKLTLLFSKQMMLIGYRSRLTLYFYAYLE